MPDMRSCNAQLQKDAAAQHGEASEPEDAMSPTNHTTCALAGAHCFLSHGDALHCLNNSRLLRKSGTLLVPALLTQHNTSPLDYVVRHLANLAKPGLACKQVASTWYVEHCTGMAAVGLEATGTSQGRRRSGSPCRLLRPTRRSKPAAHSLSDLHRGTAAQASCPSCPAGQPQNTRLEGLYSLLWRLYVYRAYGCDH